MLLLIFVSVIHGISGARRAPDTKLSRTPPLDVADSLEDAIGYDMPREGYQRDTEPATSKHGLVLPVNNLPNVSTPALGQAPAGAPKSMLHQRKKRALQRLFVGPSATVSQFPAEMDVAAERAGPADYTASILDGGHRRTRPHPSDTESASMIAPIESSESAEWHNVPVLQEQGAVVVNASKDVTTIAPEDPTTQMPTTAPVDPATPKPTIAAEDPTTQMPTNAPVDSATQKPKVEPVDPATQKPTVAPVDRATQETTIASVDPTTQEPTVAPVDPTAQEPTVAPVDPTTQEPTVARVDAATPVLPKTGHIPDFSITAYIPDFRILLSPYRTGLVAMQFLMGMACLTALVIFCGKCLCCGGCNLRRCSCCARLLLRTGWDKTPAFRTVVTVHSFNGYNDTSKSSKKQLFARLTFGTVFFQTPVTDHKGGNGTFEATKTIDVPQGTSRCLIRLFVEGKWQSTEVGSAVLFVKKDMLDRKDGFWGERQSVKLFDKKGEKATVTITFRKKHRSSGSGTDGELNVKLFPGIREDSALNLELQSQLRFWKQARPEIEGVTALTLEQRLEILCGALSGPLREIDRKGKEGGRTFVRVLHCNHSYFLEGANREEAVLREKEKASKKGLPGLQQKFYWCWYESRQIQKHKPDGYIPVAAVTAVQRSPERQDQFVVRYAHQGQKDVLIYRREGGKGLDVWIDGFEVLVKHVRKSHADRKVEEEVRTRQESRLQQASSHWLAKQRMPVPQSTSDWKQWYENLRSQKFGDEEIKTFGKELKAKHPKK